MIETSLKDIIESKKDFTLVCIDKEAIKKVKLKCTNVNDKQSYVLLDDAYKKESVSSINILDNGSLQIDESKELIVIGTIDE